MNLREVVEKYLADNDPEGFGCACEPKRTCGPCLARQRQKPLRDALASPAVHPVEPAAPPETKP